VFRALHNKEATSVEGKLKEVSAKKDLVMSLYDQSEAVKEREEKLSRTKYHVKQNVCWYKEKQLVEDMADLKKKERVMSDR
jgi:hypothetical protein